MLSIRQILVYLSYKYSGDWKDIYKIIHDRVRVDEDECKAACDANGESFITLLDPEYPEALKQSFQPPFILFYRGNIGLLGKKAKLGVVGSRDMSSNGEKSVRKILGEITSDGLSGKMAIISGMAKGIDATAEREALKDGFPVISVLGNGLDVCYPAESKDLYDQAGENHLIISEYPDGIKPEAKNFPARNRIIASLANSLLVGEADNKSGTSVTVRLALEAEKDIMCIPDSIFAKHQLCNSLIKDGAETVTCGDDVIRIMKKYGD